MPPSDRSTETIARAEGLGRSFGKRIALEGVDLELEAGSIFGLVGANGAGKTTLLRLLAGFLRASRGEVRVLGRDPRRERAAIQRDARFVFAPPALYGGLSAREHVRGLGALHGRTPSRAEVDAALSEVGLLDRAGDRVRTFSFGMRQRLALACALVPLPRLLVLDEPTDGLDPVAVRELRLLLRRLRDERGTTILFSSHLLSEVDQLADRLLVLREGRTLFSGRPGELRRTARRTVVEVDDVPAATAMFAARSLCAEPSATDPGTLVLPTTALSLEEVQGWCRAAQVRLLSFSFERPSLEQALFDTAAAGEVPIGVGGAP